MKQTKLIIGALVLVVGIIAIVVFSRKGPTASSVTRTSASPSAVSPEQARVQAHLDSLRDEMRLEMQHSDGKAAATKAEDEYDVDGLVLMTNTMKGTRAEDGSAIVGTVVNRRNKALRYVQLSFNLYDESGAQVGTAVAQVDHLEAGGQWNFKALTREDHWKSFKVAELSGF
jgi:hypothetical protein